MTLPRKLALVGAGALALAGGGAAIAAGSGHHQPSPSASGFAGYASLTSGMRGTWHMGIGLGGCRTDLVQTATTYLGVSADTLRSDLRSGKTLAQVASSTSGKSADRLIAALVAQARSDLAAAVSAGRLTQTQADTISANLQQRITDLVNGKLPAHRFGFGMHGFGRGDDLQAAAIYLGISTDTLLGDLRSGKTLAQVASSTSGKSADGLIAALVAQEKSELAAAVTAGRLTQTQADAISANLQQRVTDLVNGVRPVLPFRMHGGGMGGWGGGMMGGGPNP